MKKRRDIIINYDTSENYYVRTYVKRNPVLTLTIYVYKKELLDTERVARIDIILLPLPKILGNEIEGLERGAYERVR